MNRHRKVMLGILGGLVLLGAMLPLTGAGGSGNDGPGFALVMSHEDGVMTIRRMAGGTARVTVTLSAEHPGPVYVSRSGVGGTEDDFAGDDFGFSMRLDGGTYRFEADHGTLWSTLTYSCGGAEKCSFVVTQYGVEGR